MWMGRRIKVWGKVWWRKVVFLYWCQNDIIMQRQSLATNREIRDRGNLNQGRQEERKLEMINAKIETTLKAEDTHQQSKPTSKSISKEKAQKVVKPKPDKSVKPKKKVKNNAADSQLLPKKPRTPGKKRGPYKPRDKSATKKLPNKKTITSQNGHQSDAASKKNSQKQSKKRGRPFSSVSMNIKTQANSAPKANRRKAKIQAVPVVPKRKLTRFADEPLITEISSDQQPKTATNTQQIRGQLSIYQTSLPFEIPLPYQSKKVEPAITSKCVPNINYGPPLNKARRLSIQKKVVFESLSFFDPQAAERVAPKRPRKQNMRYEIRQQSDNDSDENYTETRRKKNHKIKRYRKILIEETEDDEEEQRYVIIKRPKNRPTQRDQPSQDKQPLQENPVSKLLHEQQPTE